MGCPLGPDVEPAAKKTSSRYGLPTYKLSHIAYEQIAEMSDLVDRISTVERSLQGSPFTGSEPTRRSLTPPRHALIASAPYTLALTTPSSLALERSKNGQIVQSTTIDRGPFTQKLKATDETKFKFT